VSRERLLATAAFRLAAVHAGLFTVGAVLLTLLIFLGVSRAFDQQARRDVQDELRTLVLRRAAGGDDALRRLIGELARRGPTSFLYAYLDGRGGRLAGDEMVPADTRPGWVRFASAPLGHAAPQSFLGAAEALPDGGVVVVARDMDEVDDFREVLVVSSAWTVAATLLLAAAAGVLMSRFTLRRLGQVTETAARIIAGDLSRRVPLSGGGDEFDRLAAQVNAMLDRIAGLMAGMREVTNDVAHDLRTPLSRLRNHLEGLLHKDAPAGEQRAAVADALGQVDAILDTFRALLRIAEIETGSRRAGFRDVDLSGLAADLAEGYAAVAEDRGQRLVASVAPGLRARGDAALLGQLLVNLIENAIRHTPPGSTVRVRAARREGAVEVAVADDGPGIPAADRERVFRRFVRLEASRSTPGSGLGLSLVLAVAELHGIAVRLGDNRPGLVVSLRLPPADAGATPRPAAEASRGSGPAAAPAAGGRADPEPLPEEAVMDGLARRSALLLAAGLGLLHPGGARAAELNLVCKVLASHPDGAEDRFLRRLEISLTGMIYTQLDDHGDGYKLVGSGAVARADKDEIVLRDDARIAWVVSRKDWTYALTNKARGGAQLAGCRKE
jgi:signal transduction histidine kinase